MTGNWPCYRFLQIEAWNACRIFYSLGLARPLQVSKKFFWDILSKIRFRSFVGLDLENRLSTHNMVISFELKAKKSIWWKNQNSFFECPFEIIGFKCWLKFYIWGPVDHKVPKNGKKGNCCLSLRGFLPLSGLGIWKLVQSGLIWCVSTPKKY